LLGTIFYIVFLVSRGYGCCWILISFVNFDCCFLLFHHHIFYGFTTAYATFYPNCIQNNFFLICCWLNCVGKEMPISRIVIAVPNATVVLLD
jgi:hypothetical protein